MGQVPQYAGPLGEQPVYSIGSVPPCVPRSDDAGCLSFVFAPVTDPEVLAIVENIATANEGVGPVVTFKGCNGTADDPDTYPQGAVVGFPDADCMSQFILSRQNYTQSALLFLPNDYNATNATANGTSETGGGFPPTRAGRRPASWLRQGPTRRALDYAAEWAVTYELWYNSTCSNLLLTPSVDAEQIAAPIAACPDIRAQLQLATDCAIMEYLLGADAVPNGVVCEAAVQSYAWADLSVNDTVKTYGVLFFFCALMFVFVVLIYQVVYEKDKRLKLGMQLMGLRESVFWVSWFIFAIGTALVAVMGVITMGYICQFAFFLDTFFFVNFFTFFLFSVAMIGISLALAVVINTSKQAINIGMLLYIVGVLVQTFLQNEDFVIFIYDDTLASNIIRNIFNFYPPFHFAKVVIDISAKSYKIEGVSGDGYSWDDLYVDNGSIVSPTPPDIWSWYWLLIDSAIFYTLAWFLANVLSSDTSAGQPPWFFLKPSYWACGSGIRREDAKAMAESGHWDSDSPAVKLDDVKKVYYKYPFGFSSSRDVRAVDGLSLDIGEGELFCVLGHNGAGKTSTINMMTGLFPPTSGSISIYGFEVSDNIETVRSITGVCPQHDILWPNLTAEEHLTLFSRLKDLDEADVPSSVDQALHDVNLAHVRNDISSSFSGGMKRRLSVAISAIGDPRIIFMDEPTTGMDPKSRRGVWALIEQLKKGRVIILTTHSMDEAEVLSDRIGIMARGTLRCCGTPLHLKSHYGQGYRLSILVEGSHAEQAISLIGNWLPSAEIISRSGGSILFSLQSCSVEDIVHAMQRLENPAGTKWEGLVQDWGISQAGIGDVFLEVTGESANISNVIDYAAEEAAKAEEVVR
eukprot:CAMPEP_0119118978 /NCGR_PEP_ID=MMETSP1310-20130426/677_1 /TAXON_ID=464262 /ORGANISM="Genus nov. species nov., Strain RCC2339" /LENGTH=859 /DNA_ID=CAMNT_0007108387 /DNA_START=286 /DNA_END=2865 /DNA_ORIENTATION=-